MVDCDDDDDDVESHGANSALSLWLSRLRASLQSFIRSLTSVSNRRPFRYVLVDVSGCNLFMKLLEGQGYSRKLYLQQRPKANNCAFKSHDCSSYA